MATINIQITITTPIGVSTAEAIDLFTGHHGYQTTLPDGSANPETKSAFAKKVIARQVAEAIKIQRLFDARKAADDAELAKLPITVE
jgi:DNA-binding LacI/PurR family transcriptional regulator